MSESANASGSPKPKRTARHPCDICRKSFARPEHLNRHKKIHTKEKSFVCPTCAKSFARSDTLNRHIESYPHDKQRTDSRGSERACRECAVGRVRCSRGDPCVRCTDRNLICAYPRPVKRRAVSSTSSTDVNDLTELDGASRDLEHASLPASKPRTSSHERRKDELHPSFSDVQTSAQPNVFGGQLPATHRQGLAYMPNPLVQTMPGQFTPLRTNWMTPLDSEVVDWEAALRGRLLYEEQTWTLPDLQEPVSDQVSWPPSLEHGTVIQPGEPCVSERYPIASPSQLGPDQRSSSDVGGSAASTSTSGRYYVDGAEARAPFRGMSNLGSSALTYAIGRRESTSLWPSGAEVVSATEPTSPANRPFVSDYAYGKMSDVLRCVARKQSSPSPTLHLPSQSHIRWYLLLYFDKFHPTFPFILQSHCQSHDAPVILLLAVSAIGSRYARSSAAAADRHLLSLALTNAMREKLWSYPDWSSSSLYSPDPVLLGEDVDIGDVAFVQAGLLLVLLELHSECRLRAERTAVDRLYLVNICKIRGLLKRKESVDANLSNEDSLRKWQLDQTRLRTGLMIWLLDTMMDYETAFGCQMLLSDANVDLPCHDEVWNNPTAESIREEGSKTVTLLHALEILYIRKAFPPHLTSLGLLLLIQGIYRKTREVVAEARTLLSSWTPSPEPQAVALHSDHDETWPPSNPTLVKWRNSACDSLDILHWSENSKIATAGGFEAPNTLHLHLARLTILTPVNHLQSLARAPQHWKVNSTAASQSEISHTRVLQWAVRDQFKARLAVIHAGSIFWHIRRYSTQSMIEAFSVYLATLVIWAYSMTVNIMKSYDKPGEQSQASQTPLEAATHATMPSDTTDASQDEEEELELSFMNLDRPVDDEMVQNYARYGQKMTAFMFGVGDICAPGAPKKILTAGIRLLSVASGQSDGGANSSYDLGKIWGHERGYHQALETLMVSSQPV